MAKITIASQISTQRKQSGSPLATAQSTTSSQESLAQESVQESDADRYARELGDDFRIERDSEGRVVRLVRDMSRSRYDPRSRSMILEFTAPQDIYEFYPSGALRSVELGRRWQENRGQKSYAPLTTVYYESGEKQAVISRVTTGRGIKAFIDPYAPSGQPLSRITQDIGYSSRDTAPREGIADGKVFREISPGSERYRTSLPGGGTQILDLSPRARAEERTRDRSLGMQVADQTSLSIAMDENAYMTPYSPYGMSTESGYTLFFPSPQSLSVPDRLRKEALFQTLSPQYTSRELAQYRTQQNIEALDRLGAFGRDVSEEGIQDILGSGKSVSRVKSPYFQSSGVLEDINQGLALPASVLKVVGGSSIRLGAETVSFFVREPVKAGVLTGATLLSGGIGTAVVSTVMIPVGVLRVMQENTGVGKISTGVTEVIGNLGILGVSRRTSRIRESLGESILLSEKVPRGPPDGSPVNFWAKEYMAASGKARMREFIPIEASLTEAPPIVRQSLQLNIQSGVMESVQEGTQTIRLGAQKTLQGLPVPDAELQSRDLNVVYGPKIVIDPDTGDVIRTGAIRKGRSETPLALTGQTGLVDFGVQDRFFAVDKKTGSVGILQNIRRQDTEFGIIYQGSFQEVARGPMAPALQEDLLRPMLSQQRTLGFDVTILEMIDRRAPGIAIIRKGKKSTSSQITLFDSYLRLELQNLEEYRSWKSASEWLHAGKSAQKNVRMQSASPVSESLSATLILEQEKLMPSQELITIAQRSSFESRQQYIQDPDQFLRKASTQIQKTQNVMKPSVKPKLRISSVSVSRQRSMQDTALRMISSQRQQLKDLRMIAPSSVSVSRQRSMQDTALRMISSQRQQQKQQQRNLSLLTLRFQRGRGGPNPGRLEIPRSLPPPPPPPPPRSRPLRVPGIFQKKKQVTRRQHREFRRYTPSVEALFYGFKSVRAPRVPGGIFTGLELRPVIRKKSRKRRKR